MLSSQISNMNKVSPLPCFCPSFRSYTGSLSRYSQNVWALQHPERIKEIWVKVISATFGSYWSFCQLKLLTWIPKPPSHVCGIPQTHTEVLKLTTEVEFRVPKCLVETPKCSCLVQNVTFAMSNGRQGSYRTPITYVNHIRHRFRPKWFVELLKMEHVLCYLYDGAICTFRHSILLRPIQGNCLLQYHILARDTGISRNNLTIIIKPKCLRICFFKGLKLL